MDTEMPSEVCIYACTCSIKGLKPEFHCENVKMITN